MLNQMSFWVGLVVGGGVAAISVSSLKSEGEDTSAVQVPQVTVKEKQNVKAPKIKLSSINEKPKNPMASSSAAAISPQELEALQNKLSQYQDILEENNLMPLSDEEIKKAMASLKLKADDAVANGDGKALLSLLKEMQKLGEGAYDDTLNYVNMIVDDPKKFGFDGSGFALFSLYKALTTDLYLYTLQKGGTASAKFKETAARGVFYRLDDDTAPAAFKKMFDRDFSSEEDVDLAKTLLRSMGRFRSKEIAGTLADQLDKFDGNAEVLNSIVYSMGDMGYLESQDKLLELKNKTTDETVLAQIDLSLRSINPPTNGVMLSEISSGGQAEKLGLKAGDIVTSFNGETVTDSNALISKLRSNSDDVTIEVMGADNQTRKITLKPGRWGVDLRTVSQN